MARLTPEEKIRRIQAKSDAKTARLNERIELKNKKLSEQKEKKRLQKLAKVKVDGLIGPADIEMIRKQLRQAWHWSSISRRICLKRATDENGFVHCENKDCESKGNIVPKIFADHIQVLGSPLAPDFIKRLYCHSTELQALCKRCHDKKTKIENDELKKSLQPLSIAQ